MISKSTIPYEGKIFQDYFKEECLIPLDLSRLKQGEIDTKIVKEAIVKLNTQSAALGIYFDVNKMEPELKGGACSTIALAIARTAVDFFTKGEPANPQPLLEELGRVIEKNFKDQANKKKGSQRHRNRVYIRSVQEAFNTITVDFEAKILDVGQAKIKALAAYYGLGVCQSTEEFDIASLSGENQFTKICENLEQGVYLLRIIQAADNHKLEVHGHSAIYIKLSKERALYFDNNLGLYNINSENKNKENLIYRSLQSASSLFYVSNFRFHQLKSLSPLDPEKNDPVDLLATNLKKLIRRMHPTMECKKDLSSLEALQEFIQEILGHTKTKDLLCQCPEIATYLFDIARVIEDQGNKKLAHELRSKTLGYINAFSEARMKEKKYVSFLTPLLTGKYPVGVTRYLLEDESRNENELRHLLPDTGKRSELRRLEIDVHYPATVIKDKEPEYKVLLVKNNLQEFYNSNFCTRSQPSLPPEKESNFPLILVSPGLGNSHDDLQHYVEELASQGFCVLTINHPYSNAFTRHQGHSQKVLGFKNDPEIIEEGLIKATDIQFVIEQIQNRKISGLYEFLGQTMNDQLLGVMGYSLGGSAAILSGGMVPDIAALLNIDGRPIINSEVQKLSKPCLMIAGDEKKTEDFEKGCQTLAKTNPHFSRINLPQAPHTAFTLATAYRTSPPMRLSSQFLEVQRKTMELTLQFFNQHLKNLKNIKEEL